MTADDPTVDGGGGWPSLDGCGADDAGYEWLLSDHPWAAAERQRRRRHRLEQDLAWVEEVLAITGRLADDPTVPEELHRLAVGLDPLVQCSALVAEVDSVVDDVAFVAEARRRLEAVRRNVGDVDYVDPAHLTGADAALVDPPTSDGPDPL